MLPWAAGPWLRHTTNAGGGHSGLGSCPWLSILLVMGGSSVVTAVHSQAFSLYWS